MFFQFTATATILPSYRISDLHRGDAAAAAAVPDQRQHQARSIRRLGGLRGSAHSALDRRPRWPAKSDCQPSAATRAGNVHHQRARLPDLLQQDARTTVSR